MAARFPLAQRFTHRKIHRFDYEYELRRELSELYPQIEDIQEASLSELWQIARDLTLSVDRLARRNGEDVELSGEEKMEIALEVIWSFIETRGGIEGLRKLITGDGDGPLGWLRSWVGRWVLRREFIEWIIRGVLELAVAEIRGATAKGGA